MTNVTASAMTIDELDYNLKTEESLGNLKSSIEIGLISA